MSAKYYNRKQIMDNRGHESIVEMTRYLVTFGTYIVVYTLLNISIAVLYLCWPPSTLAEMYVVDSSWFGNYSVCVYCAIKENTAVVCAYLSFEWNHTVYERICCYLDKCCKKRLEKFEVKKRNESVRRHLILCNDIDMIQTQIMEKNDALVEELPDDEFDVKGQDDSKTKQVVELMGKK